GGGLPGAVKAVAAGGRAAGGTLRRTLGPLSARGDDAILSEFLRRNLGSEADNAITRLTAATQAGPTALPGYQPTAAQVARVPSLASLERTATAIDPVAMNRAGAIAQGNQDVISGALDDLAGRGGARDFFAADRAAAGKQLYEGAFAGDASKNLTSGLKGEITKLLKRPDIQDARKAAQRLAANEGLKLKDGSIQGMHYMKLALDDMIGSAGQRGIGAAERNALIANRDRLVGLIENLSPDYAQARQTYAAMSKPVNAMDVLDDVASRSTTPRGNVTLDKFNRAATDDAAARVTGMRNATLASTLEPEQLMRMNAIQRALAGIDFAQTAGRGVGSDTVQKMATSNLVPGWASGLQRIPGVGALGGLAARGADTLYSRANQRLANELATALLDPAETLRLLEYRGVNPIEALAQRLTPVAGLADRAAPVAAADR
ncbi:MAG: hypothetical protein KIH64_014835, partial [Mycobacterium sp.]|nr:hypothetical protein [Mycobacterium sp.]